MYASGKLTDESFEKDEAPLVDAPLRDLSDSELLDQLQTALNVAKAEVDRQGHVSADSYLLLHGKVVRICRNINQRTPR